MEEVQQICFSKEVSALTGVKAVAWSEKFRTHFHAQVPFLYETASLNGLEALKPWENAGHYVPQVMNEWERLKNELHERFSNREQKGVSEMMRKGIAFFYELIYWCNDKPAELNKEKLATLAIKPINTAERVAFITSRPAHYHSYIQLSELFTELQKIFLKEEVKKKASKP